MGRKASRKGAALMSTLVRAEDAAEEEILETPAVSRLARDDLGEGTDSDRDEVEEEEDDEDEIERRLVEEQLRAQENESNERKSIYNREALLKLLSDWNHGQPALPWIETLETCQVPLELENVHDDLKREVAFYTNSVASVRLAKAKLQQLNIAYKRPTDYFAEMLKSDIHMAKVKDKLIYEQKKIHAVEERKKSQAHRRVAKELQAEKVKQRLQQKNETLDAVKQWKKRRNQDKGGVIHDEDDAELDAIVSGKRKRMDTSERDGKKPRVNHKREAKDKKYGFGGKKKYAKSNTKESTNDVSRFPGRAQKGNFQKRATGGKAPKGKRVGKTQRTNKRAGNKR